MSPFQYALLVDGRLSREARIMGLHVSELGEGEHAIPHETFRQLLGRGARGMAKDDTIGGYVQELVSYGWIERHPGGQGSPRYTFLPHEGGATPSALLPLGSYSPPQRGSKDALSTPPGGAQSAPTSSSTEPPPPPLDARAREWVESTGSLEGCRGALLDYVTERVEGDHQLAYVQTVTGMIEGTDEAAWMLPGGGHHRDDRQQIIAGCLNELRQGDEVGRYFPGEPGDVRNLRSKVRFKVKSIAGAKRDAERRAESPSPSGPSRGEPRSGRRRAPEVTVHGRGGGDRPAPGARAVS